MEVSKATGRAGGFTVAGPSKGPFRNRPKQKQEQKQKNCSAVFTAAAQAIRGRTYSRNSQSSTATPAEPEDLPFCLGDGPKNAVARKASRSSWFSSSSPHTLGARARCIIVSEFINRGSGSPMRTYHAPLQPAGPPWPSWALASR